MKIRVGTTKVLLLIYVGIFLSPCLWGELQKTETVESEYLDAVVLLIDAKSGMLGVSWKDEEAKKEEKLSFKVDPDKVDVLNPQNQYLEFSHIAVGDKIDILTVKHQNGKETVLEILDYNAVDPDA